MLVGTRSAVERLSVDGTVRKVEVHFTRNPPLWIEESDVKCTSTGPRDMNHSSIDTDDVLSVMDPDTCANKSPAPDVKHSS